MENNKQLGPLKQMEAFSDSANIFPPMHYNNGFEAVTQLCLNCLFLKLGFRSDNLAAESCSIFQLACCTVHHGVQSSAECDGCDLGRRENLCIRLKRLSFDQGEHYASYHCVLQNRWKVVYPKCARQLVFIVATACVLETSLFLICAFFINMWVLDMPSTVCPRLVISSRRAAIAPYAGPRTALPSYTGWVTASIPLL